MVMMLMMMINSPELGNDDGDDVRTRVELLCEETVDGGVDGVVRFGMEERSLGGGMRVGGLRG